MYEAFHRHLTIKTGGNVRWASATERKKLDKLDAQRERVGEKMFAMLEKHSPRDWMHGVPSWWIYSKLTWADAMKAPGEPLSTSPPAAFGYRESVR